MSQLQSPTINSREDRGSGYHSSIRQQFLDWPDMKMNPINLWNAPAIHAESDRINAPGDSVNIRRM